MMTDVNAILDRANRLSARTTALTARATRVRRYVDRLLELNVDPDDPRIARARRVNLRVACEADQVQAEHAAVNEMLAQVLRQYESQ